jgi:deoxyribonuclease-4
MLLDHEDRVVARAAAPTVTRGLRAAPQVALSTVLAKRVARLREMGGIRFGAARVPSRDSPASAVELLVERGYDACEVDFEGGFWMDWSYAAEFGALCRDSDIRLSVHAPIPAFLGHPERGKKYRSAVGMLDHSAGIAVACGAEPVVIHPGFLLGRARADAIRAVVEQLRELRERLEPKGRAGPFGVEVMGRARDLGSLEDVLEICSRVRWARPVLDFAHLHAVTGGGFTEPEAFVRVFAAAEGVMDPGIPFHIHFSDVTFADGNEKAHVRYGQGTLRADPLADALARFDRPATIIGESPDDASNQAIRTVLVGRHD